MGSEREGEIRGQRGFETWLCSGFGEDEMDVREKLVICGRDGGMKGGREGGSEGAREWWGETVACAHVLLHHRSIHQVFPPLPILPFLFIPSSIHSIHSFVHSSIHPHTSISPTYRPILHHSLTHSHDHCKSGAVVLSPPPTTFFGLWLHSYDQRLDRVSFSRYV